MAQTNPQRGNSPQWNQTLLFEVDDFRSALIIVLVDLSQRSDMQEIIRHEFDFNDIVSAMQQNSGQAWVVELAPPSDN